METVLSKKEIEFVNSVRESDLSGMEQRLKFAKGAVVVSLVVSALTIVVLYLAQELLLRDVADLLILVGFLSALKEYVELKLTVTKLVLQGQD